MLHAAQCSPIGPHPQALTGRLQADPLSLSHTPSPVTPLSSSVHQAAWIVEANMVSDTFDTHVCQEAEFSPGLGPSI